MKATLFFSILFAALTVQAVVNDDIDEENGSELPTPMLDRSTRSSSLWPYSDPVTPLEAAARPSMAHLPLSSSLLLTSDQVSDNQYSTNFFFVYDLLLFLILITDHDGNSL